MGDDPNLPTGRFNWVDDDDVSKLTPDEIGKLANDNSKGYLLEVDVKYPKKLHDLDNDLPFMCEKMKINGVEKLVLNLNEKQNYVVHINALNQALKHGLILEKVHRVIKFNPKQAGRGEKSAHMLALPSAVLKR